MLIPAEIILDSILEDRADIPTNAIHMHSGLKSGLYRAMGSAIRVEFALEGNA
jgi:hypothetical protein